MAESIFSKDTVCDLAILLEEAFIYGVFRGSFPEFFRTA